MPIINKTKRTAAIYNRGREVVKVYDHGKLAWQKSTSIPDYLCFTALEAGQFTLTIPAAVTSTYLSYVEWSKDGRTWNHTDNTSEAVTIDVQVASGEKVYWRGKGACTTSASASTGRQSIFSSTAKFDASGRVMSLLKGDDCANYDHLERNTVDGCLNVTFAYLFTNCDTIVNAKDLVLPTFTSFHTYIYYRTFYGCGALVSLPPLPSTELAYNCYSNLAFGCSSLLNAATLPATTLASGCYNSMYYGCTSLTKGSDLPATNLVLNCYYMMYNGCSSLTDTGTLGFLVTAESSCDRMFQSCSHLNYIKCLATDISATNCLRNWLNGVSSTGTFIQAEGVEWPRGASGIPSGWIINPDYLCFTALESGTFTLTIPAAVTPTYLSYIEWSKDGRTWNHTDNTSDTVTIDVQVASGEKVYWRGSGQRMSYSANSGYTSGFSSTCNFSVSGHLVSILKGDDFENTSFANATFARLFENCANLLSADELILPSFTSTTYVFALMFLRCTALTSAPELPPVTTLTTGCYYQMFFGCSSLNYIKCLSTNISATNCLNNWLYGVSSTGTFIQAEGVTWPRGASGIPSGWTIETQTP